MEAHEALHERRPSLAELVGVVRRDVKQRDHRGAREARGRERAEGVAVGERGVGGGGEARERGENRVDGALGADELRHRRGLRCGAGVSAGTGARHGRVKELDKKNSYRTDQRVKPHQGKGVHAVFHGARVLHGGALEDRRHGLDGGAPGEEEEVAVEGGAEGVQRGHLAARPRGAVGGEREARRGHRHLVRLVAALHRWGAARGWCR